MGADTKISWTTHTFNFLRGCRHAVLADGVISPACADADGVPICYAERMSWRNPATLGGWGADGNRVIGTDDYWRKPVAWNAAAEKAGVPAMVFATALGDLFEGRDVDGVEQRDDVRADYAPHLIRLWALIKATPWLRWHLLTKRPWNMRRWGVLHGWPVNAWAGTTTENQAALEERVPHVLDIPDAVRFLSIEPMAGAIDLTRVDVFRPPAWPKSLAGERKTYLDVLRGEGLRPSWTGVSIGTHTPSVGWVIVGGASGPRAPMLDLDAARKVVADCKAARVPVFCKQLGEAWARANGSATKAGTDPNEWPADLNVQEFPNAR